MWVLKSCDDEGNFMVVSPSYSEVALRALAKKGLVRLGQRLDDPPFEDTEKWFLTPNRTLQPATITEAGRAAVSADSRTTRELYAEWTEEDEGADDLKDLDRMREDPSSWRKEREATAGANKKRVEMDSYHKRQQKELEQHHKRQQEEFEKYQKAKREQLASHAKQVRGLYAKEAERLDADEKSKLLKERDALKIWRQNEENRQRREKLKAKGR